MSNLPSASAPLVYDHVVGAPVAFLAYTPTGAPPGAPTLWVQFDCVTSEQWTEDAEVTEHPVEEGADIADNVRVALPKCQLEVFTSNEPIQDNLFTQLQDLPLPLTVQTPSWVKPSGLLTVSGWKSNQGLRNLARSLSGLGGSLIGGATLGGENGFLVGALAGVAATVIASEAIPGVEVEGELVTDAGLPPYFPAPPLTAQTSQVVALVGGGEDFVEAMHSLLVSLKNSAQLFTVYGTKETCTNMVIESLAFSRSKDTGTGETCTIGLKQVRIVSTQVVAAPIAGLPAGGGVPPIKKGPQDPVPAATGAQASIAHKMVDSLSANQIANILSNAFGP